MLRVDVEQQVVELQLVPVGRVVRLELVDGRVPVHVGAGDGRHGRGARVDVRVAARVEAHVAAHTVVLGVDGRVEDAVVELAHARAARLAAGRHGLRYMGG